MIRYPYGKQTIASDDIDAMAEALDQPIITRGSQVEAFERAFAEYVGAAYAVAFSSGSTALNAAYAAAEVGPSDRILTTPNTFIATSAYAASKGAHLIFSDIDRRHGGLSLSGLSDKWDFRSSRGRLFLVPTHFAGIALDMNAMAHSIKSFDAVIIEDAAHALGSFYPDGKKVGSCPDSDMTIFSFHPVKLMTTGEGGMVTTNNPALYEKLRQVRNSGIVREATELKEGKAAPWYYEVQTLSCNYHLTEFQAALGLSQLKKIDRFIEKRRLLVRRYRTRLEGRHGLEFFDASYDASTAYHLMVVQIDFEKFKTTRTAVMDKLEKVGIGSQYHYIPLYRHPCYRPLFPDAEEEFPEMEAYYAMALSLPLYPELQEEEVDFISDQLLSILGN